MRRLNSKVALITGAAGDLGQALTALFIAEGAKVMAVDANETALSVLADQYGPDVLLTKIVEVTDSTAIKHAISFAEEKFGGVDIAVLNAGIVGRIAPIEEYPEDVFDQVMAVNVRGVWLGIKHVGPAMRRRGGGSIIIMSSIAGVMGSAGTSAYVASKHAVIGIARSAAKELADAGIRVNCVNPGQLDIGMARELTDEQKSDITQTIPLGRLGTAEDVSRFTLFLASDDSTYVTGSFHLVDGGSSEY